MADQSYANHSRLVPGYHFYLSALFVATLVVAIVNLYRAIRADGAVLGAVLVLMLTVAGMGLFWYCRIFPLKAQDRAIRAEENLRHFALTGALLDPRLDTRQVIGLRFASDDEFPALARKAAEEGLSEKQIKQAVEHWRADAYRV